MCEKSVEKGEKRREQDRCRNQRDLPLGRAVADLEEIISDLIEEGKQQCTAEWPWIGRKIQN